MLALQRTLSDNDLLDIMPETNYRAVVSVIERWKSEFPETYVQFQKNIDVPVNDFITAIENFDIGAYEQFERISPPLHREAYSIRFWALMLLNYTKVWQRN